MSKTLLKGKKIQTRDDGPLWRGPESDHDLGGVTQSMIGDFLTCRERFRVKYVLGLRPPDHFSHHIEYGQMWHTCEEAFAKMHSGKPFKHPGDHWMDKLSDYVTELSNKYPFDRDRIAHWYNVCKFQFPLYVEYWRKHPDVKSRTPLAQEQVFRVPYALPSGRVVHLRGKFDSVDLIGKEGIYLQENKTKGDVDPVALQRQLKFDLQTMMYLTALTQDTGIDTLEQAKGWDGEKFKTPIRGVRYNVIRRPLSGGKGSIVRHKAKVTKKGTTPEESLESFYKRAAQYVRDEPEHYFMRWKVDVSEVDVVKFRYECLDPILEMMCAWYDHIEHRGKKPFECCNPERDIMLHYRHPFGVVNSIDEYGYSDLDEYLATGSEVGLRKVVTLFTELQ